MSFEKEILEGSVESVAGRKSSSLMLVAAMLFHGALSEYSMASDIGRTVEAQSENEKSARPGNASLENKRILMQRLLSRLSDRLGEVNEPLQHERKKALDVKAQAALAAERGDHVLADRLLSEAIAMLSRTLRSAVPTEDRFAQKRRYAELAKNVTAFRQSLLETAKDRQLTERDIDLERIDTWIHQAAWAAGNEQFRQANTFLASSYQLIVSNIARFRDNETVYHALVFKDAQDEYRYEQQRYISHELLVQMMLGESDISMNRREQLSELVRLAEELHRKAGVDWKNGDQQTAIETEVKAIRELIRALRLAGLYVPE